MCGINLNNPPSRIETWVWSYRSGLLRRRRLLHCDISLDGGGGSGGGGGGGGGDGVGDGVGVGGGVGGGGRVGGGGAVR